LNIRKTELLKNPQVFETCTAVSKVFAATYLVSHQLLEIAQTAGYRPKLATERLRNAVEFFSEVQF
jgi:hypothetical protein